MNELIERIYRDGYAQDAQGNRIHIFPSAIPYESGQLLRDFVIQHKPRRTIETGLGFGMSALFISQALAENGGGRHTAIDPNQKGAYFKSIGLLNIERAGFNDAFRFFHAPSSQTLPQLLQAGERFDFAFIDGSHVFDNVIVDFSYMDKLLEIGGCIAFDDLWMPGVRRAINFVRRNRAYQLQDIASPNPPPSWLRVARSARRFLQDPSARDGTLRSIPYNVCFFKKLGDDKRTWDDYHPF